MASAHSESQSLLHDFDTDDNQKRDLRDLPEVSSGSLEDGEEPSDECEALNKRRNLGFRERLRMSIRRRKIREGRRDGDVDGEEKRVEKYKWRKRICFLIPFIILTIYALSTFLSPTPTSPFQSVPLDITQGVTPIPCHSHNDYWRRIPLYDALRHGCTGVEADVWLFDDELFVAHSTRALSPHNTFRSMYVDPLVTLLDHAKAHTPSSAPTKKKNGIFATSPEQTLVLLVDFKNDGHAIFPVVARQLEGLREKGYLSYWNGNMTVYGPIKVVATGNAPFDLVTSNTTYRDIFFDAPLAQMASGSTENGDAQKSTGGQGTVGTSPASQFSSANSFYASVNFGKAVGWVFWSFSDEQMELLREQIRGAHERGLKARYWGAPTWPGWRKERVWEVLVREGVDYLNGDDLEGMRKLLLRRDA